MFAMQGHVRLGKVLEKQNKPSNALYAYKRAFTCMMSANLNDDLIKVEILTDMASLHKFTAGTMAPKIYISFFYLYSPFLSQFINCHVLHNSIDTTEIM